MNMKDMKTIGARFGNVGKAKGSPSVDAATIRELSELLEETGLSEIEIEQNGSRIRVARHSAMPMITAAAAPAPVAAPAGSSEPAPGPSKGPPAGAVPSPMVGTVYVAPEPGKPPFVKAGDLVKEGDTLFIVEAMKTMNPIVAPKGGVVAEIAVSDAQPVEFGQTLCVIN